MEATGAPDLVVASPAAPGSDAARHAADLVAALLAHGPVHVVHPPGGVPPELEPLTGAAGLAVQAAAARRAPARAVARARLRALGVPAPVARDGAPELAAAASGAVAGAGYRRVIAEGAVAAAALIGLAGRRPVIYSARPGELGDPSGAGREQREQRSFRRGLLQLAAQVWVPSRADLETVRWTAPAARLRFVPAVVVRELPDLARGGTGVLALTGDDAALVRVLAEEALPAVRRGGGDVALTVVARPGSAPPTPADLGVQVLEGEWPGLAPPVGTGCIVLGAGLAADARAVLAALAHGLPVVAPSAAGRGTGARAGTHFLAAAPARIELAIAIAEALRGPRGADVARAGRELVQREHSPAALARRVAPSAPLDRSPPVSRRVRGR